MDAPAAVAARSEFRDGLATGLYWNIGGLAPGQSRTIVTYYGNGSATEDLSNADYTPATEAVESIGYNTNAVNDPNFLASPREDITKSSLFYTPSTFTVYGSLYNRSVNSLQQSVTLSNVSMSLNLPTGLAFGNVGTAQNPVADVSSKFVGNIAADKDGIQQWALRATGENYGALNYQLIVSVPNIGTQTLNRVINVPAAPLRNVSNAGYQMISFPFEFNPTLSNNGDPYTVVNGISRPVDDAVDFYQYRSDLNPPRYVRVTRLETGIGYYYRPSLNRTVVGKGLIPIANQANVTGQETAFQTNLYRGWSMIGNPYVYSVPLNNIQFFLPTNLQNPISFQEAVTAQLVKGGVFFRNQTLTGYDFIADFNAPFVPWEGYFIYCNTELVMKVGNPTSVNTFVTGPRPASDPLKGDVTAGATRHAQSGAISTRRALVANPTLDNWKLQLVARRQDGREDNATFIGVAENAKDGDDIRDLPKPGAPPSDYLYMGITRAEAGTSFAQEMKAPGSTKTWDFEFTSDKDGPVTVMWPNMGTLPRRLRLKLRDTQTGRSIDLRAASSVTVDAKSGVPHKFQVVSSRAESQPLVINNLRAVRAPGGGTRSAGGAAYSFAFSVNQEAQTTVRILTSSGQPIATPFSGRATTTGETRLNWNGLAQNGKPLPVGQYQVEVVATTAEGERPAKQNIHFMMLR